MSCSAAVRWLLVFKLPVRQRSQHNTTQTRRERTHVTSHIRAGNREMFRFLSCDFVSVKMRLLIVLYFCASAVYEVSGQDIEAMKSMPKYDARYDYLDVDALFNSNRLVRNYVECLINGLRCTPEGKALKSE